MTVLDPDKVFWSAVRRALLAIVRAIEIRYELGPADAGDVVYTRQTTHKG